MISLKKLECIRFLNRLLIEEHVQIFYLSKSIYHTCVYQDPEPMQATHEPLTTRQRPQRKDPGLQQDPITPEQPSEYPLWTPLLPRIQIVILDDR